jgi:hypothetical protein
MSSRQSLPAKEKNSRPWREVLPVHAAAELFPPMSPDELRALGEGIKKNGLQEPITLWFPDHESNKPQLLDGRNRLDAMEVIGIPIVREDWKGGGIHQLLVEWRAVYPPNDPYAYVISANIHRRHLTTEQKRELIAKLLKATPEKSDRAIGKVAKADGKTVAAVRAEQRDVRKFRTSRSGKTPKAASSHRASRARRRQPSRSRAKPMWSSAGHRL